MVTLISTGVVIFDLLLVLVGAFLIIYLYFKNSYQYWKRKGVPYLEPVFPYGNNSFLLPQSPTFAGETKSWYDELKKGGHKFGGAYSFSRRVLVLIDPEYIKDIFSRDFHYFTDRDFYVNEKHDPMGTHLVNVRDPQWRPLRQKFTPTFTSGKIKNMFHIVMDSSNNMIKFLEQCAKIGDDVNIREVLASFTTDVIGSVAFGIDCNSFANSHSEFREHGLDIFELTLPRYIKAIAQRNVPDLAAKWGVKLWSQNNLDFFAKVIRDAVDYREKNGIRRTDFLQILIDMNNETKDTAEQFSFEEMVANSILFFIAGFDTSSTVMTYTLYELAQNPDIQEKLRAEINNVLKKHNGQVTYDAIQEMTYLEQCVNETMRIHSPVLTLNRICTKNYQLRDTNIIIEKGTPVVVSLLGIGRDPENYPDPMKYDPNRFSQEEISKRHSNLHLPFGDGPRNCIGLRFGKMQAQIGIVRILTNFAVSISPKTKTPVEYESRQFLLKEKETLYLKIKKI